MVNVLSAAEKESLQRAVKDAESSIGAELAVMVAQVSGEYRGIILACGLAAGSAIDLLLWDTRNVTDFPVLLLIQLAAAAFFLLLPQLRRFCLRFAPPGLLHRQAEQRAAAEFVRLTRHVPTEVPFVLIYVSLAEKYVQVYPSRLVREKIPLDKWKTVAGILAKAMSSEGLVGSVKLAIHHATGMLQPHFPGTGKKYIADVIEVKE